MPPSGELNVQWYDGRLAGKLVVPGTLDFGYTDDWLVKGGYSLSPLKVPFTANLYRHNDPDMDSLPGFLSDCLPDQWGRHIMKRDFAGIDRVSPLRMLAWVGSRGIGALRFKPGMDEQGKSPHWDEISSVLLTREAQAVQSGLLARDIPNLRKAGTAGGAFPKATIALLPDGKMLSGGDVIALCKDIPNARPGILKLDSEDGIGRPSTDGRMEHAYLLMAADAGINTCTSQIIPEATPDDRLRHHLFVDRFDVVPGTSHRMHLVSLAGLLETFSLRYHDLFTAAYSLTKDRSVLHQVLLRMIFNVRSGNADDHGKNHSFLFDSREQTWNLSPAYDLTLNFSLESHFNGLFPASFTDTPRRDALMAVALEYGFTEPDFRQADASVVSSLERWSEFAKKAKVSDSDTQRAAAMHDHISNSLSVASPTRKRRSRRRLI